jgi:hypothetical protein
MIDIVCYICLSQLAAGTQCGVWLFDVIRRLTLLGSPESLGFLLHGIPGSGGPPPEIIPAHPRRLGEINLAKPIVAAAEVATAIGCTNSFSQKDRP